MACSLSILSSARAPSSSASPSAVPAYSQLRCNAPQQAIGCSAAAGLQAGERLSLYGSRSRCAGRANRVRRVRHTAGASSTRCLSASRPDPEIISLRAITEWGRRWRALDDGSLPGPHLPGPHPALRLLGEDSPAGLPEPPARVLVPMCGASADIPWLIGRGYEVVAVEAVPEAISALRCRFPDLKIPEAPQLGAHDGFERFISGSLAIYRGNFFRLSPVVLSLAGPIDWVWDRAALQLAPQEISKAYARTLKSLLGKGKPVYLVIEPDPWQVLPSGAGSPSTEELAASVRQLFPDDSWLVTLEMAQHEASSSSNSDTSGTVQPAIRSESGACCQKDGSGQAAGPAESEEFSVLVCTKTVFH